MRNLLFALILLSSCRVFQPEDFCKKHYPPIQSDSVIITESCQYDTIREAGYTILYDTILPLPNGFNLHHESNNGHLHQTVDIHSGHLTVDCKTDSLETVIKNLKTTIEHRSKEVSVVKEYQEHWYTKPLIYAFIVLLIENLILLGLKYIRK